MTFSEACQSAREGNFVSHQYFGDEQSMHEYEYDLYYEDGVNLSRGDGCEYLEKEEWAKTGWFIKHTKDKVDKEKLKSLHNQYEGRMLPQGKNYEECIIT